MTGSVRLESIDVAPDPLSYFTVVEERSINSSGETPVFEWTEIANQTGTIGGDFDWTMDLGPTTAGEHYYRFRLTGYEGGDTVCPPSIAFPARSKPSRNMLTRPTGSCSWFAKSL